jgi:uncharacterized damage-inducible protein DinB
MRLALALSLFACLPLAAQDSKLGKAFATHWATSKTYTLAVAEQMPEDQYSFKPTEAQMTFGGQMMHIASANDHFFNKMTGVKAPDIGDPKATQTKAAVIAALTKSFDFGAAQIAKATDAQLMSIVETGDGKMTMMEGILLGLDHTAHHRAQTLVYLRLKGIVPTEYKF